jgi:predicted RNase H-like nuclease (RuvC/YqgF family)
MALKKKLTADEWKKLAKDLQGEYTADGDDYILDLDGDDDDDDDTIGELRRAHDREKADNKKLKRDLREMQAKLKKFEDDESDPETRRRRDDVTKLETEWQEKIEAAKTEGEERARKLREKTRTNLINGTANGLAAEISTMPKLLAKEIRERLVVDFDDDDEPTLVVLGKNGKPSDMSLEQLKKEFVANKDFAAIIIGSKASGGGAPRSSPDIKPGGSGASDKTTDLSKLSGKELAAHLKSTKEASA